MKIDPKEPLIIELRKSKLERIFAFIKGVLYFLIFGFFLLGVIGGLSSQDSSNNNFVKTNVDWYGNEVFVDNFNSPEEYVAIVHIDGMIINESTGLYDGTTSESMLRILNDIEQDPLIRGIVVKIDSPGGTVIDSDKIAQKLKQLNKVKKVYTLTESMTASGGYYIASQTDKIFAHRESLIGSIGVILEIPNAEELFNKIGVDMVAITSGDMKNMGSPFTTLNEEERAIFQALVDESYENFVNEVANGRNMSTDDVRQLADGRIYSAKQALENGLIDSIGGLEDLQSQLEKDGLTNAQLVDYSEYISPWDELFGPMGKAVSSLLPKEKNSKIMLYYR